MCKTWKTINEIITKRKCGNKTINQLEVEGVKYNDKLAICEVMNKYFIEYRCC